MVFHFCSMYSHGSDEKSQGQWFRKNILFFRRFFFGFLFDLLLHLIGYYGTAEQAFDVRQKCITIGIKLKDRTRRTSVLIILQINHHNVLNFSSEFIDIIRSNFGILRISWRFRNSIQSFYLYFESFCDVRFYFETLLSVVSFLSVHISDRSK